MTASVLSPLAQPFHPIMGEEVHPTIFNNGVPSLTVLGSEHEFLMSITDETLDDAFPPTAEDAAELEACELFVRLMADLAMLEEREEASRTLHDGLKKRWEARRGLDGKPRSAKHVVKRVSHAAPHLLESQDIVVVDKTSFHIENRMRAMEHGIKPRMNDKTGATFSHKKPIHQPRKNS